MNDLTGKFLPFRESEEIFAEGGGIVMKCKCLADGAGCIGWKSRQEGACAGGTNPFLIKSTEASAWKGNNRLDRVNWEVASNERQATKMTSGGIYPKRSREGGC